MPVNIIDFVIQLLAFTGVVICTLLIANYGNSLLLVRRRLSVHSKPSSLQSAPLIKSTGPQNPILRWVREATKPEAGAEGNQLRRDLASAGFTDPAAPVWYVIIRFGLAIGLPLLFIIVQGLVAKPIVGLPLILFTLSLCGLGLVGPRMLLDRRVTARREQIEGEFPDVLDLLVICVEAGLGIDAAFVRVGQVVQSSHPLMAQEFEYLTHEMNAGRIRRDALESMADRIGLETIKSFSGLLIQSESLGSSISSALQTFSEEMRQKRFLRAEEKAARIPVLLTVPITACFLPVIIFSLMLPPILDIVRTLGPALHGHH
jgi:tight adherence protein C